MLILCFSVDGVNFFVCAYMLQNQKNEKNFFLFDPFVFSLCVNYNYEEVAWICLSKHHIVFSF